MARYDFNVLTADPDLIQQYAHDNAALRQHKVNLIVYTKGDLQAIVVKLGDLFKTIDDFRSKLRTTYRWRSNEPERRLFRTRSPPSTT